MPTFGMLLAASSCAAVGVAADLAAQTQFVARTDPFGTALSFAHVAAADFDGDGDEDFCGLLGLLGTGPRVRLLRNDGGERFTDVTTASLPTLPPLPGPLTRALAFDSENDGDSDLLVVGQGITRLWRNQGNGTFVDASTNLPANPGSFTDLLAADLDGDGDTDVAATGLALGGSTNFVFVNQGNGTFTAHLPLGGGTAVGIAAADIDADGDLDVLLATLFGLAVHRNDGNLFFTDVTPAWAQGLVTTVAFAVAAGDLDGDGRPDLVVAQQSGGNDRVLHNTGTTFVLAANLPNGTTSNRLLLADVDDDHDLDLVLGGSAGVTLGVNDGLGVLTLSPSRLPALTPQVPQLTACDFDRDGDRDVFVAESFTLPTLLVNRHRDLRPGQPAIGQTWHVELWSEPGYALQPHLVALGVALAGLTQPVQLTPFGELWLDLANQYALFAGVVPTATGVYTFPLAVPQAPAFVGLPLHVQGLAFQTVGAPHLSAYFVATVQ